MKIPAIKKLVANYSADELEEAELLLLEEKTIKIEVEGDDDGEQLTHIFAAMFILEEMEKSNVDFKTALRRYTEKVRNSIS
jgi:Family of unknown function (DUF6952)